MKGERFLSDYWYIKILGCLVIIHSRCIRLTSLPPESIDLEYRFMKIVAIVLHSALEHFVLCPGTLLQMLPVKRNSNNIFFLNDSNWKIFFF